ncbi:MAG TPA: 5'-nucleotidase C-terminal domain-containing protein [Bacteroidales bacterium]|nr:5'-nucleotidase C-terminal domain-containing protein [Bacteroidales bacterium]
MFKKAILFSLSIFFALNTFAQETTFQWKATRVLMDSTWNFPEELVVKGIIDFYKPQVDSQMQQVVGISEQEMRSGRPESLLSNFTVDAMLEIAQRKSENNVDFALTNFGGLRASIPAGEVRRYDIYSTYPFDNYLVIIDLKGSSVKKLFNILAASIEPLSSNVFLSVKSGKLNYALINGVQIDDRKTYRVATLDFLMTGGDNLYPLKEAVKVEQTGMLLRDVILEKIESLTANNQKISSKITNRIKIAQ